MRSLKALTMAALALGVVSAAQAELQNVEVDGKIRIRGNYYNFDSNLAINGGEDIAFVEQRTRLGVKADFTDDVTTYIEFDAYNNWGDSFRSNYITGIDTAGGADVNLYQAYIEVNNAWGLPIRTRIGRQEIALGSQWLVGVNDASSIYTGLSFDGFRTTYMNDSFTVDFLSLKLSEAFRDFGDEDVNMWGIYGSYIGLEDWQFDLYWLFLQEDLDRRLGTVNATGVGGAIAGGFLPGNSLDTDIHTIGLRGAGTIGAFDLEAEVAYQFGDIERRNPGFRFLRRNNDLDYDAWAFNLEAGYTFDMTWTPRVYLGAAYFEGGDTNRNRTFGERLFGRRNNDLAFNRLFSNWEYSEFLENTDLSNVLIYRAGISAMPTEKISLLLAAAYFEADEAINNRRGFFFNNRFNDGRNSDDLGLEVGLYADYQYSEDLVFRAGYAHFFGDSGMRAGNFVSANGLGRFVHVERRGGFFRNFFGNRGSSNPDYDYLYWEAEISF
jgi:hypothetical protein